MKMVTNERLILVDTYIEMKKNAIRNKEFELFHRVESSIQNNHCRMQFPVLLADLNRFPNVRRIRLSPWPFE